MRGNMTTVLLTLTAALAVAGPAVSRGMAGESASPVQAAAGQLILDECSPWRMNATWDTPLVRKSPEEELKPLSAAYECIGYVGRTGSVPTDWMQPDFADGSWSRWGLPRKRSPESEYGFFSSGPDLSLLCLRGKFAVDDPAAVKGLTLSIAYRGGVVVYVNGQELVRGHLPKDGKVAPETLAADYPREAFCHSDTPFRGHSFIMADWGHPAKYKGLIEKRIRHLESVKIDAKLLKKGVNVLAVEIHRAPYVPNAIETVGGSIWGPLGLVNLALRSEAGVAPNASRPAGIQVWAAPEMRRPSPAEWGDPTEKIRPVSILGCRNGAFNGRVTLSSEQAIAGVKAQAGELKHKDGKTVIPAANVKLYYNFRDDTMATYGGLVGGLPREGFWNSLAEEPPARQEPVAGAGAMQSILIKVRIPVDAAPGEYAGKITVSAEGLAAVDVPVELKVIDWKAPDPRDFVSHLGIIQSPESVALQYKVPLWSDEHWKLVEESFKVLGEMGNKYAVVPIICRTHLGNSQSMIRWVGDGEGYKQDFTVFDRYLDIAQKHQNMDVVCLHNFDMYLGCIQTSKGNIDWTRGKKSGALVTLWDPATGKAEDLEGPVYDDPEAYRKFWGPVYKEIAARMAKRGLTQATMIGISGDYGGGGGPPKELAALFLELLPGVRWVANPHGDPRGSNMAGIPIGYNTMYYMGICFPPGTQPKNFPGSFNGRYYGWRQKHPTDYHARSHWPTDPLSQWRACQEAVLAHNDSGRGRLGADFWPVLKKEDWAGLKANNAREKGTNSIVARYPESDWSQLNLDRGTELVLTPGPKGALPSEHSEQMRLGMYEAEARVFLEKAILDKKLGPELERRCQEVLDARVMHLRKLHACGGAGMPASARLANVWFEGAGSAGLNEKLFACAGEVAAKLGGK